jgi:glycosyltransferase involved in cell wall biosynthesis
MRVLVSALSCNSHHGSEALVGYKYAEALARRHAVTVLASPPAETPAGARLFTVNAGSCNFNDVGAGPLARFELRQLPRAWGLHQRQHFDLVHRVTPSWIGNASVLAALRVPLMIGPLLAADRPPESFGPYLTRAATPSSMGRLHPQRLATGVASRAGAWLAERHVHLRPARKILVGTQTALKHVPARFRGKCEPVTYSGVEHDYFVPSATRLGDQPLQLLYVGRLVPYKGLELLLRALALAAQRCDLQLRVVGGGNPNYAAFCQELSRDLGVAQRVQFTPAVPRADLRDLYQQADVFCFPTLCDTYGIALLEAMSCGCAVVVSDVAGAGEMVVDGTGLRIPLRNPGQFIGEFAEALITLARDKVLRLGLGRAARSRILAHHDWNAIGRQVLRIYEQL